MGFVGPSEVFRASIAGALYCLSARTLCVDGTGGHAHLQDFLAHTMISPLLFPQQPQHSAPIITVFIRFHGKSCMLIFKTIPLCSFVHLL